MTYLYIPSLGPKENRTRVSSHILTNTCRAMEFLKNMEQIKDYGDASMFPVYGGKLEQKNLG